MATPQRWHWTTDVLTCTARLPHASQKRQKGYMNVGMPLEARCFLIRRSVPYQLKPLVAWPMRGRCTLAWGCRERGKGEILNKRKFPSFVVLAPLEVSSQLCDLGAHIPLWPQRHRGSDERCGGGRKCPSISRQSSLTVNTTNCCDGDNKTLLKHALCETRRRAKPTSYFQN